jgi:hypothetical protein
MAPAVTDVRASEHQPSKLTVDERLTVVFVTAVQPAASTSIPCTPYDRRLPAIQFGGPKLAISMATAPAAVMPDTVTVTDAYKAPTGAVAMRIGGGVFHPVVFTSVVPADVTELSAVPPVTAAYQSTRTVAVRPATAVMLARYA